MQASPKPQTAYRQLIGLSGNDKEVYAHMVLSDVSRQISRQPHLLSLLREALATLKITGEIIPFEYDFKQQIGYSEILETREKDTIFYAKKLKADTFTRFVKHRRTESTTYLAGTIIQDADGEYEIVEMHMGRLFPPTPDHPRATAESKAFWEDHAVVYNGQQIAGTTKTNESPY